MYQYVFLQSAHSPGRRRQKKQPQQLKAKESSPMARAASGPLVLCRETNLKNLKKKTHFKTLKFIQILQVRNSKTKL